MTRASSPKQTLTCDLIGLIKTTANKRTAPKTKSRHQELSAQPTATEKLIAELSQQEKQFQESHDPIDLSETSSETCSTTVGDWQQESFCGDSSFCSSDTAEAYADAYWVQSCANDKRNLPCCKFISTGACPYGVHCTFIHDQRCITVHEVLEFLPARRHRHYRDLIASFDRLLYWPKMNVSPRQNVDNIYNVDYDSEEGLRESRAKKCENNLAVFSMWAHFLSFCLSLNPKKVYERRYDPFQANSPLNIFTGRRRLPVFQMLAADEGDLFFSRLVLSGGLQVMYSQSQRLQQ